MVIFVAQAVSTENRKKNKQHVTYGFPGWQTDELYQLAEHYHKHDQTCVFVLHHRLAPLPYMQSFAAESSPHPCLAGDVCGRWHASNAQATWRPLPSWSTHAFVRGRARSGGNPRALGSHETRAEHLCSAPVVPASARNLMEGLLPQNRKPVQRTCLTRIQCKRDPE